MKSTFDWNHEIPREQDESILVSWKVMPNKTNYLYKYKPFDLLNTKWTDEVIKGNLYMPSLSQLNDPFEEEFEIIDKELIRHFAKTYGTVDRDGIFKALSSDPAVDIPFLQAIFSNEEVWQIVHNGHVRPFIDRIRVQCLSKRKDSISMWTYYASEFKGILFEYQEDSFKEEITRLRTDCENIEFVSDVTPVEYTDNRLFPMNKLGEDAFKNNIFKKYSDWQMEEEHRIALILKDPELKIVLKVKPSKVYYGFRMSRSEKDWIIEKANEHQVAAEEMEKESIKTMLQKRAVDHSLRELVALKLRNYFLGGF